ncbi:MAG: chorismate--pyruvate lyase family protein [Psychrobium sp.]
MTPNSQSPPKSRTKIVPNYHSITMPFKQGLTAHWLNGQCDSVPQLREPLSDWLLDSASLTKRLTLQSESFKVIVLQQSQSSLSQQEKDLFERDDIECREVLLICDNQAQVYARTLIPKATLEHANKRLATLGNTSLGEVLFSDPSMRRSTIEVCQFNEFSPIAMMSQQLLLPAQSNIWARRSMFYLQDYPLCVVECFLPGSLAYSKSLL